MLWAIKESLLNRENFDFAYLKNGRCGNVADGFFQLCPSALNVPAPYKPQTGENKIFFSFAHCPCSNSRLRD
jgi:hypothetical protein